MIPYVLRRLLVIPVIIFLVTLILFSLMWQLPLELRARIYVPDTNRFLMPEEQAALVERAIRIHGLDQPWPVQYVNWLRLLVAGDWGYSPVWQQPVLEGLLQRVPATAELLLVSMVPCAALALALGSLAAQYRAGLPDHVIRASAFVGWAFPSFILGLILGLSGRTGLADWGWMLNTGRNWIIGTPSNAFQYWYTYLPPIAAIVLFSMGWNLIGDGLRDLMDPRTG